MSHFIRRCIAYQCNIIAYRLSHLSWPWLNQLLISFFVRHFKVNLSESSIEDINKFKNFDAFFTRRLKHNLRKIHGADSDVISPVDGILTDYWKLDDKAHFQVKGDWHNMKSLLMLKDDCIKKYEKGIGFTFYLAPWHYHRIHMPIAGEPNFIYHIPGFLNTVNPQVVEKKPWILIQNERLVIEISTQLGPLLLIMVGARLVGMMETQWTGLVNKGYENRYQPSFIDYSDKLTLKCLTKNEINN